MAGRADTPELPRGSVQARSSEGTGPLLPSDSEAVSTEEAGLLCSLRTRCVQKVKDGHSHLSHEAGPGSPLLANLLPSDSLVSKCLSGPLLGVLTAAAVGQAFLWFLVPGGAYGLWSSQARVIRGLHWPLRVALLRGLQLTCLCRSRC